MKKLINKLRIRRKKSEEKPSRITTETIAEHRERILAGGRRFKYPVQVARHRLVFLTVSIAAAAILLFVGFVWWQLYSVQASNDFMYRITQVVPLPVANVDGQQALYSDYLMKYRSSIHYLTDKEQVDLNTTDGKRQAQHVEYQAMQDTIADAYAIKIANQKHITVSNNELQLFLAQQRQSPDGTIPQSTYNAVILDYYGWSPQEYQHETYNQLLRQKVSYAVDTTAKQLADKAGSVISSNNGDLHAAANTLAANNKLAGITYGVSGMVPKDNQDGGLAAAAAKMQVNAISGVITPTTGDGYYIIKVDAINDSQVNYEYIHIPLTAFNDQLAALQKEHKITQYISTPDDSH